MIVVVEWLKGAYQHLDMVGRMNIQACMCHHMGKFVVPAKTKSVACNVLLIKGGVLASNGSFGLVQLANCGSLATRKMNGAKLQQQK